MTRGLGCFVAGVKSGGLSISGEEKFVFLYYYGICIEWFTLEIRTQEQQINSLQ